MIDCLMVLVNEDKERVNVNGCQQKAIIGKRRNDEDEDEKRSRQDLIKNDAARTFVRYRRG